MQATLLETKARATKRFGAVHEALLDSTPTANSGAFC